MSRVDIFFGGDDMISAGTPKLRVGNRRLALLASPEARAQKGDKIISDVMFTGNRNCTAFGGTAEFFDLLPLLGVEEVETSEQSQQIRVLQILEFCEERDPSIRIFEPTLHIQFQLVFDFGRQAPERHGARRIEHFFAAQFGNGESNARLREKVSVRQASRKNRHPWAPEHSIRIPPAGHVHFPKARNRDSEHVEPLKIEVAALWIHAPLMPPSRAAVQGQ